MIKSRRLRWADHVARMEDGRSALKHEINVVIIVSVGEKSAFKDVDSNVIQAYYFVFNKIIHLIFYHTPYNIFIY